MPQAAAGYNSSSIVYQRQPQQIETFAHSEWIDTPARMLAPMIVSAVTNDGGFAAVVRLPGAVSGDLRLDTEILRLQQEFGATPSRVRFTLRASLADNRTGRVLAWRNFDQSVVAAADDPYGGVIAANQAVRATLEQLAAFCREVAGQWQPTPTEPR